MLLACNRSVFDRILPGYYRDPIKYAESNETLWSILTAIISDPSFTGIYCVIGEIHECEDHQSALLSQIKKLFFRVKGERPVLKLLITSRQTRDISLEFGGFPSAHLQANQDDLRRFVHDQVSRLPKDFSVIMRDEASVRLLQGAGMTFLWVSIVLGQLKRLPFPSISSVKDTVERSPKALDELYDAVVEQILNQAGDVVVQLLIWIVYVRSPLTLAELQAALATKIGCRSKKDTEGFVIELMDETINNSVGTIAKVAGTRIHLIHQSAKNFLVRHKYLSQAPVCNGQSPDVHLARVCMTYLNFGDFKRE